MKRLEVHESEKFIVRDCESCKTGWRDDIKKTYPNSIPVSDHSAKYIKWSWLKYKSFADNYGPMCKRQRHKGFADKTISCARKLDIGAILIDRSEAS